MQFGLELHFRGACRVVHWDRIVGLWCVDVIWFVGMSACDS